MLDIKFLRENPEIVKQNIKNKFQDSKLPLVDEVIALDLESREVKQEADNLRSERNRISKQIGGLMAQESVKREEMKKQVTSFSDHWQSLRLRRQSWRKINNIMMVIPNIIDSGYQLVRMIENVGVRRI